MAIGTPTVLDQGQTSTDNTANAAGSSTPSSGEIELAFWLWSKATAPDAPTTVSGTNGFNATWTSINELGFNTNGSPTRRFGSRWAVASSSVAGVLTWDWGANTQTGFAHHLCTVVGVNTTTPLVSANTVAVSGTGVTTVTLTYNQNFGAGNIGMFSVCISANCTAPSTPTGWHLLGNLQNFTTPASTQFVYYSDAGLTSPAPNPSWTTAGNCRAIGFELAVAGSNSVAPLAHHYHRMRG